MSRRIGVLVAAIGIVSLALTGCSTEARAERKGKAAADQICKAKNADNANDAQRHLRKADDKLDDLSRFTGRDVREDIRDLDRNLDQLSRGNGTSQDVNAIVRSVEQAKASSSGNAEAAYDGMLEGLANCD
jgi:hypothetical protein